MSGRAARWLVLAAVGTLFVLALLAPAASDGEPRGSARSAAPRGRLALVLLLRELGWDARAWSGAPGDLPADAGLVFLGGVPAAPPGWRPEQEEGPAEPVRRRDPGHYRRFLEQGGVLVAVFDQRMRDFLADDLGLEDARRVRTVRRGAKSALRAELESGETITLGGGVRTALAPPESVPFRVLARQEGGDALALVLPVGRGRLCLTSAEDLLDNRRLERGDDALFAVRLVEALAPRGALLFDEYALGDWEPASPLALAFAPARRGLALHVVALLAVLLWGAAWAGPFAREGAPLERVAPRERARAQARFLARAGRFDLLARALATGVARRLAGGAARAASEDATQGALRALFVARLGEAEWEEARAAFARGAADEDELERLGRELAGWERRLAAAGGEGP